MIYQDKENLQKSYYKFISEHAAQPTFCFVTGKLDQELNKTWNLIIYLNFPSSNAGELRELIRLHGFHRSHMLEWAFGSRAGAKEINLCGF